ncbi:MAG: hypothetical protein RI983_369 [Bacteroidota bacterium]
MTPRKLVVGVLLSIQVLPLLLFAFLQLQKQWVKLEMEKALASDKLERFVLERHEFTWVEEGREMKIRGVMFDVVAFTQLADGRYQVDGLTDHREQAIHEKTNQLIHHKGKFKDFLVKLIVIQSMGVVQQGLQLPVHWISYVRIFFTASQWTKHIYLDIIVPPPRG